MKVSKIDVFTVRVPYKRVESSSLINRGGISDVIVKVTADNGLVVTCVQVAGLIARRILCYVKMGDQLAKGQRYGFIRFGSRVDVYLPVTATPKVAVGDKVSATETILAQF